MVLFSKPPDRNKTAFNNESFNSSSSNNSARKLDVDDRLNNFYNDGEELKVLGK